MSENTSIEWADHTFNLWEGCAKISEGCKPCYAEAQNKWLRRGANWGISAPRRFNDDRYWQKLEKWNAAALRSGVRARVFVESTGDIFELHPVPEIAAQQDAARARLWEAIPRLPGLVFLLLTKRPENARLLLPREWVRDGCPSNVALGVSVENPDYVWRVDVIQEVPAALYFLSCEPLLGRIELGYRMEGVGWVLTGCESRGSRLGSRRTPIAWFHALQVECWEAGVPFLLKQADICSVCDGARCVTCEWTGQTGDLRKGCPAMFGVRYDQVPEVLR